MVVRPAVTDIEALVTWVLDLLDHAEVLRPDSVRAAVVGRLEAWPPDDSREAGSAAARARPASAASRLAHRPCRDETS